MKKVIKCKVCDSKNIYTNEKFIVCRHCGHKEPREEEIEEGDTDGSE